SSQPIRCQNWLKQPMRNQLEFDCDGYTDGTSGGPFLARVSQKTGQGTVIGVIGGYQQGGDTPDVSYSAAFGTNVAALYRTAVAGTGGQPASRGYRLAPPDLAGQQAVGEREVGQHPEAEVPGGGGDLGLGTAVKQRPVVLGGYERGAAVPRGEVRGVGQLPAR